MHIGRKARSYLICQAAEQIVISRGQGCERSEARINCNCRCERTAEERRVRNNAQFAGEQPIRRSPSRFVWLSAYNPKILENTLKSGKQVVSLGQEQK